MKRGFAFEKLFKKKLPGHKGSRRPVVTTKINVYGKKQSGISGGFGKLFAASLSKNRKPAKNRISIKQNDNLTPFFKIGVILFLIGVFYLVFGSNVFMLDKLEISGNRLVEKYTLENAIFKAEFSGVNALLFNEDKATYNVLFITQIKSVEFEKDILGHRLVMVVDEHETSLIWQTNNQRFLVNRAGVAYDIATSDNPLTVVEDLKNVPVNINQKILTTDFIEFVNFVAANLARKTPLNARRITVPETTFELEIETNEGWKVVFDTSKSPDTQLNNLSKILLGGANPQEYVDLRIIDRVYYK
ncbi:MAG: hypothetical protein U9M89_01445 [Patescibacteria group bacterium]|nr:hypothetical protein [Patescibacteria group bacterium]